MRRSDYEWVAAACAAGVAAALLEAIRSLDGLSAVVPLRRLPGVFCALAMVPVDFGIVTLVLVRSIVRRRIERGEFVAIAFEDDGATVVLHDLVPNGVWAITLR